MLQNLLPGIRELRSPLAAGYIWIVSAWLLFFSYIPSADQATGIAGAIYQLADVFTGLGAGVALSFVAYLLGSLSQEMFAPLLLGWGQRGAPSVTFPETLVISTKDGEIPTWRRVRRKHFSKWERKFVSFWGASSESESGDVTFFVLRHRPLNGPPVVSQRGVSSLRKLLHDRIDMLNQENQGVPILDSPEVKEMLREGRVIPSEDEQISENDFEYEVIKRISMELDLVAMRLIEEQVHLHSVVDRLRAESEFRVAVIPPLVVFLIVLSLQAHVSWLLALPFLYLYYRQARTKRREAGDMVADALLIGRVEAPTLEKLGLAKNRLQGHAKQTSQRFGPHVRPNGHDGDA